jgi:general secretion pathway protein A
MYNQFFRLRENPFNVNPDPRYLFLTRQTGEAWDGLKHGINSRKGLLLLTGEVGTGKTTLLNHLLDWLHQQRAPTAFIFNSHLEINQLFDFVLSDFAVKFDARLQDNALMRLHLWLWERYRAGETPVVIVDEAQGLPNRVLEEIRMLLNLESSSEKLLQIVLAGQPELEARLQQPELRQVKQRIALRCKTAALSLDEAHQYVHARLHIAGADASRIFASDAMDAVHFYSRGIPRVMNLLCEHALIHASAAQIRPVPARFVAEVAGEFQFDDNKPVPPSPAVADHSRSSATTAQSRFLSALRSLSVTDENQPPVPQRLAPSVIPTPRSHAGADNVFTPVPETAAPFLRDEILLDDSAAAAPFVSSTAPSSTAHSTRNFAPASEHDLDPDLEPVLARELEPDFASRSAEAVATISARAFATISEPSLAPSFQHAFEQAFTKPFTTPFEPAFAPAFARAFTAPFEPTITLAFERAVTTPSEPTTTSAFERAVTTPSEQNLATPSEAPAEPSNLQPNAPAATWHRQLETRLLAEWTSLFSEVSTSLSFDPPADPTPQPVTATHPTHLHLVESKTAPSVSAAATRRQAPSSQNPAPPSSTASAAKSFAPISVRTKLVALRVNVVGWTSEVSSWLSAAVTATARRRAILAGWTANVSHRLSSAITATARSRAIASITQLSAHCQSSAKSLCWEGLTWASRCLNIFASADCAHLWLVASTWLRQPCDPTQWRLQDVRPFNELLRFNHKKM